MYECLEFVVGHIAEILNIPILFYLFHRIPVTQSIKPGDYQEGRHDPERFPYGSLGFIVKLCQTSDGFFSTELSVEGYSVHGFDPSYLNRPI